MLPRLDPTDIAIFGRVGKASRAAVLSSGLPHAGANIGAGVPFFELRNFVGSVERLAWARDNKCPLVPRKCGCVRRTCGCGWDARVCQAGTITRPLISLTKPSSSRKPPNAPHNNCLRLSRRVNECQAVLSGGRCSGKPGGADLGAGAGLPVGGGAAGRG